MSMKGGGGSAPPPPTKGRLADRPCLELPVACWTAVLIASVTSGQEPQTLPRGTVASPDTWRTPVRQRPLVILAVLAGIVFIIIGIVYFLEPAKSLPGFFPGHESGSDHHHTKHGIAAVLVGIACFIFAWFQSGPKQDGPSRHDRLGSEQVERE